MTIASMERFRGTLQDRQFIVFGRWAAYWYLLSGPDRKQANRLPPEEILSGQTRKGERFTGAFFGPVQHTVGLHRNGKPLRGTFLVVRGDFMGVEMLWAINTADVLYALPAEWYLKEEVSVQQ